jgi:Tfp pilus assembly protein PilN
MAQVIWPRRRRLRLCVGGLDLRDDGTHWVVLAGSAQAADGVCCAESLTLPEGSVMHGQLVQPQVLGRWFKDWLQGRDLHIDALYVAVPDSEVMRGSLRLPLDLQADDVAFQIAAELQAAPDAPAVCWDYAEDDTPLDVAPAEFEPDNPRAPETRMYAWGTAPLARVGSWQQFALAAGLCASAVMPRHDALALTQQNALMVQLSPAHAGLALQYDTALGLALRAWHDIGFNFLPHRAMKQQAMRRRWWQRMAAGTLAGACLAVSAAAWMSHMAASLRDETGDLAVAEQALKQARSAQKEAQTALADAHALRQWLRDQTQVQQHTLQWSRVLAKHSQGLWVSEVKQQQAHWLVKGEALSAAQAQHLAQQLKGLDIWAQAPELRHLELTPPKSAAGLSVWHFRIEADLKAGV